MLQDDTYKTQAVEKKKGIIAYE